MKKYTVFFLAISLCMLFSYSAFAKTISNEDKTFLKGRAYISYENDLLPGSNISNQFEITRIYLDYISKLPQASSVRITTDISRNSTLESYNVFLKYAYFEINRLNVPFIGLQTLIIGQSATHWIDFMQQYWKFRYVEKTLNDKYEFFSSADLGLAGKGRMATRIPYFNIIEYHATLMNGEGYKKTEANGGKDVALTLTAMPLAHKDIGTLTVAGGVMLEDVGSNLNLTGINKKLTAMLAYENKNNVVFVEYANQLESATGGMSVGGQYYLKKPWNVFARLDNFQKSADKYQYSVYGFEYIWSNNIRFAIDYAQESKNSSDNERKISIHSIVKW